LKAEVKEIVEDRAYNKYRKTNGSTASNVIKNDGRYRPQYSSVIL